MLVACAYPIVSQHLLKVVWNHIELLNRKATIICKSCIKNLQKKYCNINLLFHAHIRTVIQIGSRFFKSSTEYICCFALFRVTHTISFISHVFCSSRASNQLLNKIVMCSLLVVVLAVRAMSGTVTVFTPCLSALCCSWKYFLTAKLVYNMTKGTMESLDFSQSFWQFPSILI